MQDEGKERLPKKKYSALKLELEKISLEKLLLSENNNASAYLAEAYMRLKTAKLSYQDRKKIVDWFKSGVDQGNLAPKSYFADCYVYGFGVKKNQKKGIKLYREAAKQNSNRAIHGLALCYRYGLGMQIDWQEAVRYFRILVEKKYIPAFVNLANCYKEGVGVDKDLNQAASLYRSAIKLGFRIEKKDLEEPYLLMQIVALNCLAQLYKMEGGIGKDIQESTRLYKLAAERGSAEAQLTLAKLYLHNKWVPQDHKQAIPQDYKQGIKYLNDGVQQNHAGSQMLLGWCYATGTGVEKNCERYTDLYKLAAKQGSAEAQYILAQMYLHIYPLFEDYKQIISKDNKEAINYLNSAVKQGDAKSQALLAGCYYEGQGVKIDYKKSVELSMLAAAQGDNDAQYNLAFCYEKGKGVEQDLKAAAYWFLEAAIQGCGLSKKRLSRESYRPVLQEILIEEEVKKRTKELFLEKKFPLSLDKKMKDKDSIKEILSKLKLSKSLQKDLELFSKTISKVSKAMPSGTPGVLVKMIGEYVGMGESKDEEKIACITDFFDPDKKYRKATGKKEQDETPDIRESNFKSPFKILKN